MTTHQKLNDNTKRKNNVVQRKERTVDHLLEGSEQGRPPNVLKRITEHPQGVNSSQILQLQQIVGNRATSQLLAQHKRTMRQLEAIPDTGHNDHTSLDKGLTVENLLIQRTLEHAKTYASGNEIEDINAKEDVVKYITTPENPDKKRIGLFNEYNRDSDDKLEASLLAMYKVGQFVETRQDIKYEVTAISLSQDSVVYDLINEKKQTDCLEEYLISELASVQKWETPEEVEEKKRKELGEYEEAHKDELVEQRGFWGPGKFTEPKPDDPAKPSDAPKGYTFIIKVLLETGYTPRQTFDKMQDLHHSLSLISETKHYTYKNAPSGFIVNVPPDALYAATDHDISTSLKPEEKYDQMSMRHKNEGLATPKGVLKGTREGHYADQPIGDSHNELVALGKSLIKGNPIKVTAIFIRKEATTQLVEDEGSDKMSLDKLSQKRLKEYEVLSLEERLPIIYI